MWIHSTLVFLALLFVLPGLAMFARPAAGSHSNPRHSKKQKENLDNIVNRSLKGPDGQPLKGVELLKQSGASFFIKDGKDITNLDQMAASSAAHKAAISQKVQQEQADIYQNHKAHIDSLKEKAQNLNTKPRRDEDGQLSIHDINHALGLHMILTDGDIVPSPNSAGAGGGAPSLFQRRFRRAAPLRDYQYPDTIWTNGVNWDINSTLNQAAKDAITAAIAFWQQNTCITFNRVNAATADPSMYPIVVFFPGDGCWSPVGRQASVDFQKISIGAGCEWVDTAAHELAHSLGVSHTQSRYDRDDSIYIDTTNTNPDNYGKMTTDNNYNYGIAYDYRSVMHYFPEDYATDPTKPVIYALNPAYQLSIGSHELPTFADVAMMNLHYACYDRCNTSGTFCYYGGYPNPNNCKVCQCPNGFGGNDCSLPEPPTNGLTCGDTLGATKDWQFLNLTNQVGNGKKILGVLVNPSTCTYHIYAPIGSTLQFSVNFIGANGQNDYHCHDQCLYGALTIKGISDSWKPQGMRFCCPAQYNQFMNTTSNLLLLQPTNNYYYTDFSVQYKIA